MLTKNRMIVLLLLLAALNLALLNSGVGRPRLLSDNEVQFDVCGAVLCTSSVAGKQCSVDNVCAVLDETDCKGACVRCDGSNAEEMCSIDKPWDVVDCTNTNTPGGCGNQNPSTCS